MECFTPRTTSFGFSQKGEGYMSQFPIARKYSVPIAPLDRQTSQALVRSTNRITLIGELTRKVQDEISITYATAGRLASAALNVVHDYARRAPQDEMPQAYFQMVTHGYLQRMIDTTELGNV